MTSHGEGLLAPSKEGGSLGDAVSIATKAGRCSSVARELCGLLSNCGEWGLLSSCGVPPSLL